MAYRVALVVPIRGFDDAKSRLSTILSPQQRRLLAQNCASRVLARSAVCDRYVVCDDDEVGDWSTSLGATPIHVTTPGLNPSLTQAVRNILSQHPVDFLLIVHADLPLPDGLDAIITKIVDDSVTQSTQRQVLIVPDRHGDGTNVLGLSSQIASEWEFSYGPGSNNAHQLVAERLQGSLKILSDPHLSIDLDTPDDLAHSAVRDVLPLLIPDWNPDDIQ